MATTTRTWKAARETTTALEEAEALLERIQQELQEMKAGAERGDARHHGDAGKVLYDLINLGGFLGVATEAQLERVGY